jgi:hypothetical protein
MAIRELFSRRQKRLRGEAPDVFQYDDIPQPLRVQVVHILEELLSSGHYEDICDIICRETGRFYLGREQPRQFEVRNYTFEFVDYFLKVKDADSALDCVELAFQMAVEKVGHFHPARVEKAVEELNARFKQHGVGYEFADDELIRVDSKHLHEEAVKPALVILRGKEYASADDEFRQAYEHYRHGRHEDALVCALKSFESVMKVICTKRGWMFNPMDPASKLIKALFDNKLLPDYLQNEITGLRTTLESGIVTLRNKQGGHGAGAVQRDVPEYAVSYGLHLTASSILFITEAEAALE